MNPANAKLLSARAYILVPFFLLLAILGGCLPQPGTDRNFSGPRPNLFENDPNTGRLSFFLTLKDDLGPAIRLEVDSIELAGDGYRQQLISKPLILDSAAIGTGQLFLGSIPVPPGSYQKMFLTVTKGETFSADGRYEVLSTEPFLIDANLSTSLDIDPGDSHSILVTWDVENSLQENNTLLPALTASLPLRQMLLDLVFVACPDIDTVYVVRADKNWVVDSFGLEGGPTYLTIAPDELQLLYVLATRGKMIKTVDLSTYRVVNMFPVPLNDNPTFMTISPDGRAAFLLDERSGYITRINLTSGQIEARILLSFHPKHAVFIADKNLLAVSLSLSQKVLLLDPATLQVVSTISTGSSPQGVAVFDNQLFVAESGDNTVSVTDLGNRSSQSRLAVGFDPRRLLEAGNQIYVSNYLDGSISVLVPGQLGVIQEIRGLGQPLEMAFDLSYLRLYVADGENKALAVIDTNSNKLLGNIHLGTRPAGMDVIQ